MANQAAKKSNTKTAKAPTKSKTATNPNAVAKGKLAANRKAVAKPKATAKPKVAAKPKPPATPEPIAEVQPIAAPTPAPVKAPLPTSINSTFVKALTKHLKRIGDADLAAQTVAYVLNGDDADVLLSIGKAAEAGKSLALSGVSNDVPYTLRQDIQKERVGVYGAGKETPPVVWSRLGEVFEAAARASGRKAAPISGWPDWLASALGELVVSFQDGGSRSEGAVWPAERLVALFAEAKLPPREALRLLFDSSLVSSLRRRGSTSYYYGSSNADGLFSGWPEVLTENLPAIRESLEKSGGYLANQIVPLLTKLGFDYTPTIDVLAALGASSSKSVRDTVAPVLHKYAAVAVPHLDRLLTGKSTVQRNEAAALLWRIEGEKAIPKLKKQLAAETAEKVKQTLERLLAAPPDPSDGEEITFPPLAIELGFVPFPEVARARIRALFQKAHETATRAYEQELVAYNAPDRPSWKTKPTQPAPLGGKLLDELFEFVSGGLNTLPARDAYRRLGGTLADESFAPPQVHFIHIVRLCYALHRFDLERGDGYFYWSDTSDLDVYRGRGEPPPGLRELDAAVATLPNGKPGIITFAYLQNNSKYRDFCDWEPEALWPAFAERLDVLRDALAGTPRSNERDYYIPERKRNAFTVLAAFPKLPPGFVPLLWDIAMGEIKTDRAPAQAALRTLPEKAKRVVVGLTNTRQSVRDVAAEWLGNIGDKSAVPALKTAFRKEAQEVTKGVIMIALEKLGADVTEFLDRKALAKEAEAGMKKPPKMYGIELDKVPAVHWADTGKPVDPTIVQWWLVQAAAQNAPACGPILRRYLAMCRPLDRSALAKYVLTGWLERGGSKGLLAIVSAGGDADCVRMSEKFIRTWFGQKMSQCKSLIEMLAWVKHPMALQVLLSIANRFRTAGLRTLASQFVNALAEREGWTLDELADRTIPDGGFAKPAEGGNATLVLDYGARQFTAKLDDELEPILQGEGGKIVKALPSPAKADDAVKAKEAKKAFTDAKKQVKDVVKRQSERMYEALCTQRAWAFADWKQFLGDHPIVGRMCVRLAWSASEPGESGKFLGCFRPLEDGSLTNEKDDAVTFPPETLIRLAHTANTPPALAAVWKQHFTDYTIEPVFEQFGRATYTLPEAKTKETAITDFQGYELGTFQMRGKMTKAGYVRGEAQDGGWFHEYLKPFRSLGICAEIEFSGNSLPEEDRRAALGSLSFTKMKPEGDTGSSWHHKTIELGKVPPVLLSECYNDLKQLAGEGTGFNPEWEKSSYY